MSHSQQQHQHGASYDGSSMDHFDTFTNDGGSMWGNESQFDNATMYQDANTTALDFGSTLNQQQIGHDDCKPCNSPDCGEAPCPEGEEAYECSDPTCFTQQANTICHDASSHGQCGGDAPPEVLDAAYHLYVLNGGQNHVASCDPGAHVHGNGMQGFHLNNPSMMNTGHSMMGSNSDFYNNNMQMSGFNMTDVTETFCNPNFCDFNLAQGYGDEFYGCYHFPEIGHDLNQLHQFHHHKQQWADGMCPATQSHALSPIVQSVSDTGPSEIGGSPRRPTSTPITSSSNGSPIQANRKFQMGRKALLDNDLESEDETEHICQWLGPDAVPCGQEFSSADLLQEHACQVHINHLTKAKPGFYCRWEGCERLAKDPQAPFAQKSKLERHIQKHTGYKSETCDICGKRYATAQTLAQHKKIHEESKGCKCTWPGCNYATAQPSQLTMHMRTKHLNYKPLSCEICGQKFSESSNLSKHKKTHVATSEWYCGACGKCFGREDQVRRHWKKHTRDEDARVKKAQEELVKMGHSLEQVKKRSILELTGQLPVKTKPVVLKEKPQALMLSGSTLSPGSSRPPSRAFSAKRPRLDLMTNSAGGDYQTQSMSKQLNFTPPGSAIADSFGDFASFKTENDATTQSLMGTDMHRPQSGMALGLDMGEMARVGMGTIL